MTGRREAETAASRGVLDMTNPDWPLIECYDAGFEAGAASRQGEVDRLAAKVADAERLVTLTYRGAECVHPTYFSEMVGPAVKRTRSACGRCWGCQLAKAAADYRGLK